ncbi:MAG: 6,7-dimethyl-8-ribityllumazine synthase [Candidatus Norongarragalinales archaeon]
MRIAIITADFNEEITSEMEKAAVQYALKRGVKTKTVRVPGSFDMPLAIKKALKDKKTRAVAALGAIIKGETKHDEVIGFALAKTIHELELQYDKPVGFGIIGPGASWKQAKARAKDYGERAVEAAIALSKL